MCSKASCSTQTSNTMCSRASFSTQHQIFMFLGARAQQKYQLFMCLRADAQHKYLINYVLQGPRPTHEIIYIKHILLDYNQYIKQIIILRCSGVLCPIYKIKHQSNITCNGTYAHECQVKNLGYYIILQHLK